MPRLRGALLLASLTVGACQCSGDSTGPRAYDVGVPLSELPRSTPANPVDLVPGDAFLVAETSEASELIRAAAATPEGVAWSRAGGLRALAATRTGSTLSALAQRLNDLSRAPIGGEVLEGLLDGPLTLAIRAPPRGGMDLLAIKHLPASARAGLRLAEMLEAVHPSAQQVRVERYRGIPMRHLRLDGERMVYYFVLRDTVVVGTNLDWVKVSLDLALGDRPSRHLSEPLTRARARCTGELACVAIDATEARDAPSLGLLGRALAGLDWVVLRYSGGGGLELGVHRALGGFGLPGPTLALPHEVGLVLAREALPSELLAIAAPAPDAGEEHTFEARALLRDAARTLDPVSGRHAFFALTGAPESATLPGQQVLFLESAKPAAAEQALVGLASRLFRTPPSPDAEGAWCEGDPPVVCSASLEGGLELTTGRPTYRGWMSAKASSAKIELGALTLYLDLPWLLAALAHNHAEAKSAPSTSDPEDLHALSTAMQGLRPRWVRATSIDGAPEAWGRFAELAPSSASGVGPP